MTQMQSILQAAILCRRSQWDAKEKEMVAYRPVDRTRQRSLARLGLS